MAHEGVVSHEDLEMILSAVVQAVAEDIVGD